LRTGGSYDIGKLTADRFCERKIYLTSFGVGIPLLQLWEQSKDIPANVMEAYKRLVGNGFDKQLIKA